MPINFTCGKCQKAFTVADSSAGKQGRCKDCGHLNTIPNSNVAASAGASAASNAPAMYEVTSAINGSVFGPADKKTLKQWAGENRITPKCKIKQVGTQNWISASDAFPSLRTSTPEKAQLAGTSNDSGDASFEKFKASKTSEATALGGAAASSEGEVNPFASGTHSKTALDQTGNFAPTTGDIGFILSHAFKQYKERFGTVLGGFLLSMAAGMVLFFAMYAVILFMVFSAVPAGGGGVPQIGVAAGLIIFVFYILMLLANTYFSAGLIKLLLKVGRGEPASATDVFSTDNRFLQVLGYGFVFFLLIFGLMMFFGFIVGMMQGALGFEGGVVEGVLGILSLIFMAAAVLLTWPGIYLIIDRRTGVMGAFSLGGSVAAKNIGQFIVVALVAMLVYLAGALLLGVGIFLTLPLAMLIIACAYLNMTGQIGE